MNFRPIHKSAIAALLGAIGLVLAIIIDSTALIVFGAFILVGNCVMPFVAYYLHKRHYGNQEEESFVDVLRKLWKT